MLSFGEADTELSRKKEISHKVKALKATIHTHEADAAQLAAEHDHLQRQLASLQERLQRLENQVILSWVAILGLALMLPSHKHQLNCKLTACQASQYWSLNSQVSSLGHEVVNNKSCPP